MSKVLISINDASIYIKISTDMMTPNNGKAKATLGATPHATYTLCKASSTTGSPKAEDFKSYGPASITASGEIAAVYRARRVRNVLTKIDWQTGMAITPDQQNMRSRKDVHLPAKLIREYGDSWNTVNQLNLLTSL